MAQKASGGTTVAGTLILSEMAGIKIFATGGIGGVHRDAPFDISTDLGQLAKSKVIVVCAGAKAILDLPATLEQLETLGVPVIGYQTDEFPAFYSRRERIGSQRQGRQPGRNGRHRQSTLADGRRWPAGNRARPAKRMPSRQPRLRSRSSKPWQKRWRKISAGRRSRPSCSAG